MGFDYQALMQNSLRRMIGDVLSEVALGGLPGAHHFYISFKTRHAGVSIPVYLYEQYPEEMTIILQNWFDGLAVMDDRFAVTLSFNGKPEPLVIPFGAITGFADPSVEFNLRFEADEKAGAADGEQISWEDSKEGAAERSADDKEPASGNAVLGLVGADDKAEQASKEPQGAKSRSSRLRPTSKPKPNEMPVDDVGKGANPPRARGKAGSKERGSGGAKGAQKSGKAMGRAGKGGSADGQKDAAAHKSGAHPPKLSRKSEKQSEAKILVFDRPKKEPKDEGEGED